MGVCSNKNICCVGDNLGPSLSYLFENWNHLTLKDWGGLFIASDIVFSPHRGKMAYIE